MNFWGCSNQIYFVLENKLCISKYGVVFFLLKNLFWSYAILILLKIYLLLEVRFERNVNIYKIFSFKNSESAILVSKSFSGLDYSLLLKNDQLWKTFQMIYDMTMFRKKTFFPAFQLWRHIILIWRDISFSLHFGAIVFY